MKYLINLLLSINFLNASMLLDSKNICIDDFYSISGSFYYLDSASQTWIAISTDNQVQTIFPNFIFDSATGQCKPNSAYILGMQETEYNFLLGIVGVILGAVFMFFTTQIFTMVGGRR